MILSDLLDARCARRGATSSAAWWTCASAVAPATGGAKATSS